MTRLAEAGCSVHEIQAFSGHKTLSEIAHYTSSVEQAALAQSDGQNTNKIVKTHGPYCQKTRKRVQKQRLKIWMVGPGGFEPPTRPL